MVTIAAFSTDWNFQPAPTEDDPGRKTATYGGTYYYRMALPYTALGYQGYTTWLSYAFDVASDGHVRCLDTNGEWQDPDVVVFQRWMHKDGATMARRAQAAGQVIINDVDDHFWALPRTNIAHKTTDPNANPDFNRDHYREMLKASDAVICSTDTIARFVERQGVPAFVCRNAVDITAWPVHDVTEYHLGWTGGIPWRGNDLPILRGILGPFLEQHGLDFYHGGDSPDPSYPKAWQQLGIDINVVPYASHPIVPTAQYPALWNPITTCIVPLERCTFNEAKSWLKALEASACGIPYIASDLPEQRLFVEDGGAGRLARKGWQWLQHFEELLDVNVRRREGALNRAHAEQWSIQNKWTQWDAVFRELVPTKPLEMAA